jgi:hypothetical protein
MVCRRYCAALQLTHGHASSGTACHITAPLFSDVALFGIRMCRLLQEAKQSHMSTVTNSGICCCQLAAVRSINMLAVALLPCGASRLGASCLLMCVALCVVCCMDCVTWQVACAVQCVQLPPILSSPRACQQECVQARVYVLHARDWPETLFDATLINAFLAIVRCSMLWACCLGPRRPVTVWCAENPLHFSKVRVLTHMHLALLL